MKNRSTVWEYPQVVFCANSESHYIIENNYKYQLPLYLAILLNQYLRNFREKKLSDPVSLWIKALPIEERQLIRVYPQGHSSQLR